MKKPKIELYCPHCDYIYAKNYLMRPLHENDYCPSCMTKSSCSVYPPYEKRMYVKEPTGFFTSKKIYIDADYRREYVKYSKSLNQQKNFENSLVLIDFGDVHCNELYKRFILLYEKCKKSSDKSAKRFVAKYDLPISSLTNILDKQLVKDALNKLIKECSDALSNKSDDDADYNTVPFHVIMLLR